MPDTHPATIERHPKNPEWVRLKFMGLLPMYADFDPCPVRGLTAEQAAREWCRRVLGQEAEPADLTMSPPEAG